MMFLRPAARVSQSRSKKPFEAESMAFWEYSLRPWELALDVGAYSGIYAIRAGLLNTRCWAFEPSASIYERLRKNIIANRVNHLVKAYQAAASDKGGEAKATISPGGYSSAGRIDPKSKHTVTTVSLDSFVGRFPFPGATAISVIKVDVEGHELKVLAGAEGILETYRPNLILEANTAEAEEAIREALPQYSFKNADRANLLGEWK